MVVVAVVVVVVVVVAVVVVVVAVVVVAVVVVVVAVVVEQMRHSTGQLSRNAAANDGLSAVLSTHCAAVIGGLHVSDASGPRPSHGCLLVEEEVEVVVAVVVVAVVVVVVVVVDVAVVAVDVVVVLVTVVAVSVVAVVDVSVMVVVVLVTVAAVVAVVVVVIVVVEVEVAVVVVRVVVVVPVVVVVVVSTHVLHSTGQPNRKASPRLVSATHSVDLNMGWQVAPSGTPLHVVSGVASAQSLLERDAALQWSAAETAGVVVVRPEHSPSLCHTTQPFCVGNPARYCVYCVLSSVQLRGAAATANAAQAALPQQSCAQCSCCRTCASSATSATQARVPFAVALLPGVGPYRSGCVLTLPGVVPLTLPGVVPLTLPGVVPLSVQPAAASAALLARTSLDPSMSGAMVAAAYSGSSSCSAVNKLKSGGDALRRR